MAKLPNIIEKQRSLWTVIKFVFLESINGSKWHAILYYACGALNAAFSFLEYGSIAVIVNEFVVYGTYGARIAVLAKALIMILAAEFLPSLIASIQTYAWQIMNDDLGRYMQSRFFIKMQELDIGTIEQPELQNIFSLANSRGWGAIYAVINSISSALKNMTSLVIASISMVVISPLILLIILAGTMPTYFIEKRNADIAMKLWKDNAESWRIWTAKVSPLHNKNSLTELKNYGIVNVFRKKFLSRIGAFHEAFKAIRKKSGKYEVLGKAILTAALGVAVFLLMHKVYAGSLAVGLLVFSFSVISRFQGAANQMFDEFGKLSERKKSIDIVMDFYEMEPLVKSGAKIIDSSQPIKIEFKSVSFAYPGSDKNVLEDISLKFSQGDNIAIVGLNGAGKTTLIKLLTRVYDPTEGEILVNGISLKEYDLESWKQCLGILLQEYTLYSEESIAENIMLGDVSKHDQVVVESSAKETTANEFIEALPDKYHQKVGTEFHGGVELSKGQKQKLALARVLYRNAPIVVLDEPTASVDALSEDTIFRNLKINHNNQTRIIISHKFSNVRDSDQIILIEHGKIIEEGSHEKLMKKRKGKYRELFNLQAEGYR